MTKRGLDRLTQNVKGFFNEFRAELTFETSRSAASTSTSRLTSSPPPTLRRDMPRRRKQRRLSQYEFYTTQ